MAAAPSSMHPAVAQSASAETFIELRGIHKHFGNQEVLCGIDLKLYHGETLCVIGPSGEGKTVMIKHIIGLIQPDEGDIFVAGMHVNRLHEREMAPIRQKVSMLFQGAALFDRMTVEENVAFPLLESGVCDRNEIKQRVLEALTAVDLDDHLDKYPTSLCSAAMESPPSLSRMTCAVFSKSPIVSPCFIAARFISLAHLPN